MKDRKIKGNSFPFSLPSYDPPIEGHRQACPAKFISDYRDRLNRLFFAGARGGHPYYLSGSDFMEVLALNAILASFPLSRLGFASDYRFVALGMSLTLSAN
jgi:hypothetical protein